MGGDNANDDDEGGGGGGACGDQYPSNGFVPHLYPQHLINVNSNMASQPFQSPMHVRPPFIPLSAVPQYYMLDNMPKLSSLSQLPLSIQHQLMKHGLPANAIILPIDQVDKFKQAMNIRK